jgi:hypothetical protein
VFQSGGKMKSFWQQNPASANWASASPSTYGPVITLATAAPHYQSHRPLFLELNAIILLGERYHWQSDNI